MSYHTSLRGGFVPREYMRYRIYRTPVGPEDQFGDIHPGHWSDEDVEDYYRHKRLYYSSNTDPPAKRSLFNDRGEIELKDMSSMNIDGAGFRYRARGMRVPPALQYVSTFTKRSKVGGRVRRRLSSKVKLAYALHQTVPSVVKRVETYRIQARAGEQALVTYMACKTRSLVNAVRGSFFANPPTEVGLDEYAFSNDLNADTLPMFSEAAAAGSAWSTTGVAIPARSWTLFDNWSLRDMLLYCLRAYTSNTDIKGGYIPPSVVPAGGTYFGFTNGPSAVSGVLGFTGDIVAATNALGSLFPIANSRLVLNNTNAGLDGEHGVGFAGKNLYCHGQGIDFTITNLEETPVYVTVYELICRGDKKFLTTGVPTGDVFTPARPAGCGLPDPVELWQTMQIRRGTQYAAGTLDTQTNENSTSSSTEVRRSVYEVGMDPMHYLDRWYTVKKRTVLIEAGSSRKLSYYVKYNGLVPPSVWDTKYAMKGLTRTYMIRAYGSRSLARDGLASGSASMVGTTSSDASIRVDVSKYYKATLMPIRKAHNWIERVPRVTPGVVVDSVDVLADGTLDVGNAQELGGTVASSTSKVSFAENTGALA